MTSSNTGFELNSEQKLHIIEWNHLNLYKFYPMALTSSWSVRCLLYPMSVVKARLQLQRQSNVYTGMCNAFKNIIKQEGYCALYRGFWVTVPQISASFLYSGVYEKLRDVIGTQSNINSPPIVSALAGGVASTCTQLIFVPTDIIAQYMMIYNNPGSFSGSDKKATIFDILNSNKNNRLTLGLRVIKAVYKVDGFIGFYRGFCSSLFLYIPSSMVFWSTYYNTLNLLKILQSKFYYEVGFKQSNIDLTSTKPNRTKNTTKSLLAFQAFSGAIGGVSAAICTNPLEIIRIRIQVHRTSFRETVRRLIKFEGFHVFTKGLAPRIISNGIYSCLLMIGYESVKRACVLPEYKNSIVW